jgi:hypothetical protein
MFLLGIKMKKGLNYDFIKQKMFYQRSHNHPTIPKCPQNPGSDNEDALICMRSTS